jgi:hypothetical protein
VVGGFEVEVVAEFAVEVVFGVAGHDIRVDDLPWDLVRGALEEQRAFPRRDAENAE